MINLSKNGTHTRTKNTLLKCPSGSDKRYFILWDEKLFKISFYTVVGVNPE